MTQPQGPDDGQQPQWWGPTPQGWGPVGGPPPSGPGDPRRPWVVRHKILSAGLGVFGVLVALALIGSVLPKPTNTAVSNLVTTTARPTSSPPTQETTTPPAPSPATEAPATSASTEPPSTLTTPPTTEPPISPTNVAPPAPVTSSSSEYTIPAYVPPPADAQGNPPCVVQDSWDTSVSGTGISAFVYMDGPTSVAVTVVGKSGSGPTQAATITPGQTVHQFDFPDVEKATVSEVLLRSSTSTTCYIVPFSQ